MKKLISVILTLVLICTLSVSAYAKSTPTQKEEVVYGILALNGDVENIYVVNIFSDKNITDYGDYTAVQNLTTTDEIKQSGDEITITSSADKLYYQGTLKSKQLPWDISIKYTLDGKSIDPQDLAGKSGKLEIELKVAKNSKADSSFYNNYALQITIALNSSLCANIITQNATIAEAGGDKQFVYTVLPGEGADISLTADVRDFEMDAITINGIKLALNLDIDYSQFTEQISQLTDTVKQLYSGAADLLSGAQQLSDGMGQYVTGLKAYKDGMAQLDAGVVGLQMGADGIESGLNSLAAQNASLVGGAQSILQSTFDNVNSQLAEMNLGLPTLTPENYSVILEGIPSLASIKAQLDGVVQFVEGLKGYTGGVSSLSSGAKDLSDGVDSLKTSTSQLASSVSDLYTSAVELNAALGGLKDGLSEYKNGTSEFVKGTADIDTQIADEVDDIIDTISGSGGKTISFVSDKNTNITAVQFVLKADGIQITDAEDDTNDEQTAELTFWQKLLKLFGLYNEE